MVNDEPVGDNPHLVLRPTLHHLSAEITILAQGKIGSVWQNDLQNPSKNK